jgi:hypothetical protein
LTRLTPKKGMRAARMAQAGRPKSAASVGCEGLPETRKASEAVIVWFAGPTTTRKPWCSSNRVALCLSYPVHRSLPPTRRSNSDATIIPIEARSKPLPEGARLPSEGLYAPG